MAPEVGRASSPILLASLGNPGNLGSAEGPTGSGGERSRLHLRSPPGES